MRKAHAAAVLVLAGFVLSGCGAGEDKPQKARDAQSGGDKGSPSKGPTDASAEGTMIDRAAGSWKTISKTQGDKYFKTVTIADGHVTMKGAVLDCSGTLKPDTVEGKEAPSLTLTCKGGSDGGRGVGNMHLGDKVAKDDAVAFDWKGPKGGWGGPVDSFRRTS